MAKKLYRKFVVILCSLTLVFGVTYSKVTPVKAIYNFWVEVSDPSVGVIPTYKFHFSIEKKLEVHKYIKMIFPPGTTYTKDPRPHNETSILFDPFEPYRGVPIIGEEPDGSVSLQFNTHIERDPKKEGYRDIVVTIPYDTQYNIANPTKPGTYVYKIATQAEPRLIESYPVQIFKSTITTPIVDVEAPKTNDMAGFSLDFKTSSLGELNPEKKDFIRIRFPDGFVFTKGAWDIKPKFIMINATFLLDYPLGSIQGNDFLIPVPIRIRKGSQVSIKIDCRVGIKTATNRGSYQLLVATSKDTTFIPSTPFELK